MRKIIILFSLLVTASIHAQVFNVDTIVNNGPGFNRLNIIYLGDGYTYNDLGKYESDIQQLSTAFIGFEPLSHYREYINVFRVDVVSEESGVSHEQRFEEDGCKSVPIMNVNNYFGSRLDAGSVHRLLAPLFYSKIFDVLTLNVPDYDLAFIVANTGYYGGSGGTYPTTSMSSGANKVLVHEFGHGFAKLGDEYSYTGSTPRETPNTTQETRRDSIKWNHWIEPNTPIPTPATGDYLNIIGLFEGAAYNPTGWFRPKIDCLMRSNGAPFCEVCAEAILMRLFELVNPIDNYFPENSNVNITDEEMVFKLKLLKPQPNTLKTEWFLDNEIFGKNIDSLFLSNNILTEGNHKLSVSVFDTTLMIKNPLHFISNVSTVEWDINVSTSGVSINSNSNRFKIKAYPNPFVDKLTFEYELEKAASIKLYLVDLKGNKQLLDEGFKNVGLQTYTLNPTEFLMSAGNYFLNIEVNGMVFPVSIIKL